MSKIYMNHQIFLNYWLSKIGIEDYLKKKKDIYNALISFIESEDSISKNYQNLVDLIELQHIKQNREEFRAFLYLILQILKNHHRSSNFSKKFELIFTFFSDVIKQNFSNSDLFYFFESHKLILYILIKNKIVQIDQSFGKYICENETMGFKQYFYPELKPFLDVGKRKVFEDEITENNSNIFSDFDEYRENGENDSYICRLIRDDSVEEFVSYVNRNKYPLSGKIRSSIFETNPILNKEISIIEYASFLGSSQIVQYLKYNNVKLSPSLWIYSVHGKNPELIHFLEENHVEPKDKSFEEVLKEAIKCHHNDIANYIINNLLNQEIDIFF